MRIVHCRREPYDVYIGRPSEWGNPFRIGPNCSREEVIRLYENLMRARLAESAEWRDRLRNLRTKTLGCWCKPEICHGDILNKLLDELDEEEVMAYQNGKPTGADRQYKAKPWNDIHKAMFKELLALPRMKGSKTDAKLREWAKEKEPSNALKCYLLQIYAEWVHRPKKEVIIRPFNDNGNFPSSKPEGGSDDDIFGDNSKPSNSATNKDDDALPFD